MKDTQQGFTLIELMITVAIIGILAGIAYPSYQEQVYKSRRADAKGALLGLANALERHFTESNSYCDAGGTGGTNSCGDSGTKDTGSPSIYPAKSPLDGTTKYYDLTITAVTDTSFTVQAAPAGAQANDKCGTLSLTNTGVKAVTGSLALALCW